MGELERPDRRVGVLVECQRVMGKPDCLHQQLEKLEAVSADDVLGAVSRWLGPEGLYVLSVVPSDVEIEGVEKVELP